MLGTQTLATLIAVYGLLMRSRFLPRPFATPDAGTATRLVAAEIERSAFHHRIHQRAPILSLQSSAGAGVRLVTPGTNAGLQLIARPDLAIVGIEMSFQGAIDRCRIVCWAVFDRVAIDIEVH